MGSLFSRPLPLALRVLAIAAFVQSLRVVQQLRTRVQELKRGVRLAIKEKEAVAQECCVLKEKQRQLEVEREESAALITLLQSANKPLPSCSQTQPPPTPQSKETNAVSMMHAKRIDTLENEARIARHQLQQSQLENSRQISATHKEIERLTSLLQEKDIHIAKTNQKASTLQRRLSNASQIAAVNAFVDVVSPKRPRKKKREKKMNNHNKYERLE